MTQKLLFKAYEAYYVYIFIYLKIPASQKVIKRKYFS